jgi:hypothetical protein
MGTFVRRGCAESTPDLPARRWIVVQKAYTKASFGSDCRSRHPSRARPHHDHVKARRHPVTTSIPGAQISWHVRLCGTPSTVARHSMQMPMPQSGLRASPVVEKRLGSPAIIKAAATQVPAATCTCLPFTVMEQFLSMAFIPWYCNQAFANSRSF